MKKIKFKCKNKPSAGLMNFVCPLWKKYDGMFEQTCNKYNDSIKEYCTNLDMEYYSYLFCEDCYAYYLKHICDNDLNITNFFKDEKTFLFVNKHIFNSPDIDVTLFFENITEELIIKLKKANAVIGCVAWLTNDKILKTLSEIKNGASIILQKESFIKENNKCQELYKKIKPLHSKDYKYDCAIRCCGHNNSDRKIACPRMHNKFLVFGDIKNKQFTPYAVWTGSFNLTDNAVNSLENALYINNINVATYYFEEWKRILSISEKMIWTTDKYKKLNLNDAFDDRKNIKFEFDNISLKIHCNDLEQSVVKYINDADVVVGCIAWLTNKNILTAMSNVKHGVSIIVQKEDFLRPDLDDVNLQKYYNNIKPFEWYYSMIDNKYCYFKNNILDGLNTISRSCVIYDDVDSDNGIFSNMQVRCFGNNNSKHKLAFPRMHHKFVVLCKTKTINKKNIMQYTDNKHKINDAFNQDFEGNARDTKQLVIPYAVWTGSFNFTNNGTKSLENAIYIQNNDIADIYYQQWMKIIAQSEPLDWNTTWSSPAFRIGT